MRAGKEGNGGIVQLLRKRGHEVTTAWEAELTRAAATEILLHAARGGLILVTYDERRFLQLNAQLNGEGQLSGEGASEHAGILIVPQVPHEDIPRIAEAIIRLAGSEQSISNGVYRLGLLSGWARVVQ